MRWHNRSNEFPCNRWKLHKAEECVPVVVGHVSNDWLFEHFGHIDADLVVRLRAGAADPGAQSTGHDAVDEFVEECLQESRKHGEYNFGGSTYHLAQSLIKYQAL